MGRNLEYSSALQLIQNEDYLDDSDIDELRFFQRQGRFIETNKQENQSLNRVKRQTTHQNKVIHFCSSSKHETDSISHG